MTDSVDEMKRDLRRRFRFERNQRQLGGDWLHLIDSAEFASASTIASYLSYGDEPVTTHLNESILRSGKTLLLPLVKEGEMIWVRSLEGSAVQESRTKKKRSKSSGAPQPVGEEFVGAIDIVICPALRVDRTGVRLGQGGGHYDRALIKPNASSAWKIALLHDEEVSTEPLPTLDHDVRMDAVALPEILVRFKRG